MTEAKRRGAIAPQIESGLTGPGENQGARIFRRLTSVEGGALLPRPLLGGDARVVRCPLNSQDYHSNPHLTHQVERTVPPALATSLLSSEAIISEIFVESALLFETTTTSNSILETPSSTPFGCDLM